MRRRLATVTAIGTAVCVALTTLMPDTGVAAAATSEAVFDDFIGPAGVAPDGRYWDYDVGRSGRQLQIYAKSTDTVRLDGAGNLLIEARPTPAGGITSGRLVTRNKLAMTHGTLSARIKMPSGQGISPAFWLLGTDVDDVGWPRSGEIDIIEMPNVGTRFYTTLHGPWVDQPDGADVDYKVISKGPIDDLSGGFRTYWITRAPNLIVVGVDDVTTATFTPDSLNSNQRWVFDKPMYAILNIAVGDKAAGLPDATTPWPATMLVDWFRWKPA